MKKVLATLLAVLLLTCVFATVAMAAPERVYEIGWNRNNVYVGDEKPSACPWNDDFVSEEWKNKGSVTIKVRENGKTVEYNATKWSARCDACDAYYWDIYGGLHWVECLSDHMFTIYVLGDKVEHEHKWDNGKVTTPATCTTEGVKTFKCTVNGCTKTKTEPIEMLGHDLEKVDAVDPTCTKGGNIEYWQCQREGCGKLFSDSEGKNELEKVTLDMLGHDFEDAKVEDYNAEKHVYLCNRCKGEEEGGKKYEGHVAGVWVCKDEDVHVKMCTVCGHLMATKAHTYGAGVVSKMPTCWSKGEVKYTCTVCRHTYTKELPALGHYFETVTIESTCTGEGYTAQKCIRCGLIVSQGVLDPKGHKPGDWEVTKAATCTEKGQEVKTCTVCGVVVEMREIDALGHDWGEWETVKEPTTEAEGEEKRVCKRDATHVETRPIAKLEPTPAPTEEPTVEPTVEPTAEPTMAPTAEPTAEPTAQPTVEPTKKPDKTDIPKTGDNSHFGYAYLMIAVAAAGLVVLAATRRKEGSK